MREQKEQGRTYENKKNKEAYSRTKRTRHHIQEQKEHGSIYMNQKNNAAGEERTDGKPKGGGGRKNGGEKTD